MYQPKLHVFVSSRVWSDLSDVEKGMYTRHALDLICLDCGQVGSDGFKHAHRCQEVGYHPMEAVNFLKECEICHQYFVLVARLVLHSLLHHLRLPSLMCVCGKSFYNKAVLICMWRSVIVATTICLSKRSANLDHHVPNLFQVSLTVICKLILFFFSSSYIVYLQDVSASVI